MSNKLGILNYDYVEFFLGSAKMTSYWYIHALGFKLSGYRGPETGHPEKCSYYLTKNNLKILLTSAIKPESYEINDFVLKHGDGVRRWAVKVDSVEKSFEMATNKVAVPIKKPVKLEDEYGCYEEASIKLYDDVELVFIDNSNYNGVFKPGYRKENIAVLHESSETGLIEIDHIVGNVRENEMNYWENYLNESLDFETCISFGPGDISTRYSALLSKVVHAKDDVIKNPINEPYKGRYSSQIEEFINAFHGSGVQHIALKTDDIIKTVSTLRKNGIEFIEIPNQYYSDLLKNELKKGKTERITQDIDLLKENGILCDIEGTGYLLQTFTKPLSDRPTFFYEIIQRCNGACGFGQGNFKALFEAIEHDQDERGTLKLNEKG